VEAAAAPAEAVMVAADPAVEATVQGEAEGGGKKQT